MVQVAEAEDNQAKLQLVEMGPNGPPVIGLASDGGSPVRVGMPFLDECLMNAISLVLRRYQKLLQIFRRPGLVPESQLRSQAAFEYQASG